jgi:hypothetical protein
VAAYVRWSTERGPKKCANTSNGSSPVFSGVGMQSQDQERNSMNAIKLLAIALLLAGTLGLVYGGFSYTQDTTAVKVGSLELTVKEQKQVNIPLWAGIGAIVAGGLLLLSTSKRG